MRRSDRGGVVRLTRIRTVIRRGRAYRSFKARASRS